MSVKCYNIVEVAANDMKDELPLGYTIDEWKEWTLRYTCEKIDELAREIVASKYEVWIEERTKNVFISITAPDLIAEEKEHVLYEILQRSKSVVFTHGEGDNIQVRFELDGIWSDLRRKAGLIR